MVGTTGVGTATSGSPGNKGFSEWDIAILHHAILPRFGCRYVTPDIFGKLIKSCVIAGKIEQVVGKSRLPAIPHRLQGEARTGRTAHVPRIIMLSIPVCYEQDQPIHGVQVPLDIGADPARRHPRVGTGGKNKGVPSSADRLGECKNDWTK